MASSKSGMTKEDRERFLLDHGYTPLRGGKGSHEIWEHTELKMLARTHKVAPPGNVLPNASQIPWEITLPHDPARGTWGAIVKLSEWCITRTDEIKNASTREQLRCKVFKAFQRAVGDVRQWKKDLRHHLKAGLSAETAPVTPIAYEDFKALTEQKKQLSKPAP